MLLEMRIASLGPNLSLHQIDECLTALDVCLAVLDRAEASDAASHVSLGRERFAAAYRPGAADDLVDRGVPFFPDRWE